MSAPGSLRIAIVGNCQITGLAAAARAFLPTAEVKAWHVGVHPTDSDEHISAQLSNFDLIIAQLSKWDTHEILRISWLRERELPVIYLPSFVFAGFHPDSTYLIGRDGLIRGPAADYHSIIVASAYVLGVPERRVPSLFNNFVFAELGYFDAFEAEKAALFTNFGQEGMDIRPLFDLWMQRSGPFMYTINHPKIFVLLTLCRLALAAGGLIDPQTPIPDDVDDYLSRQYTWPVYPALAQRLGISGSTLFARGLTGLAEGQSRNITLIDFIAGCYKFYVDTEKSVLRVGSVAAACDRLQAILDVS